MLLNIEGELLDQLLIQEETQVKHNDYTKEISFYELVKHGKVEVLQNIPISLTQKGLGKLSDNYRFNVLYHFIVCTAMITRFCIEGGMNSETAYTLSDLYIQKADKTKKVDEITVLHRQMIFDFAYRMKQLQTISTYSNHIYLCIQWIDNHIHKPISTMEVSDSLHLNKSYLCTLFKKETGTTIGNYILYKRIELAKIYLCYTEYTFVEISNFLCFCSHSHFIRSFKKQTGMTPGEYQKKYAGKYFNHTDDLTENIHTESILENQII